MLVTSIPTVCGNIPTDADLHAIAGISAFSGILKVFGFLAFSMLQAPLLLKKSYPFVNVKGSCYCWCPFYCRSPCFAASWMLLK
jgi:hypothetical protein